MKTYGSLYPQVCDFENLLRAARRAARGKKKRPDVAEFLFDLEPNVLRLRTELLERTYQPGPYHQFAITDPKPRVISAAPFRDRVVHHALCRVVEPLFDRSFIYDSYACRVGKGTHRALDRFTHFARRFPYVLKSDIRLFFPNVDHQILCGLLKRKLRDEAIMWLVNRILRTGTEQQGRLTYFPGDNLFTPLCRSRGLPIGNLTSQFWANVYLDPLDHFVREELRVEGYVRYCDDFAIFGKAKRELAEIKAAVQSFVRSLRLTLHPTKSMVYPTQGGVAFLGFKVFPDHRLLLRGSVRRFRRRAGKLQRDYETGRVSAEHITRSVQAWVAHAAHGDTYHLRERLLGELVFSKG